MARKKEPKPPTPWEIAKPILKKYYLDGRITDSMKPSAVYRMREEFTNVIPYTNFRNNFRTLKNGIKNHTERANIDQTGLLHDIAIYSLAKDTDGYWDGSEAQSLLKEDIKRGLHKQMRPKLLWNSRPQYQDFDLKTFRDHIHQQTRSEIETNYWIVKKRKKKRAEEAKTKGQKVNEEDMDFLYDPVINM